MKTLTMLLTTTALAFGSTAFAADTTYQSETKIKSDKDGSYSRDVSAERKDEAGKVSSEQTTKVDVDSDGSTTTVTTEHADDPKGLLNKKTVKTKEKLETKSGHTQREYKKTVDGQTVVDTKTEAEINPAAGGRTY